MTGLQQIDILVLGLGPAGSSAAARAAKAGQAVLALDRKRTPGIPVQCAEFVPALIGQEINSLREVTAQGIDDMVTYITGDEPHLKPRFPGRMIERDAFDAALVAEARNAGVECRFGQSVTRIDQAGTVHLSSGQRLRAKVLIGADGPRSRAGKAAGNSNADVVETRQITVPLHEPHAATDIFLSPEIVGGYGWLFPKSGVANLGAGVVPAARGKLKNIVEDLHAHLVAEGRVGAEVLSHTGGAIPVGGMVIPIATLGETSVILAGDAAGLANPVTGAGISSAVISGGLAGDAAAKHLGGDGGAFEDYVDELQDLFKPALDRALERRRELLDRFHTGEAPSPAHLRRGWIAYPEYWAA